MSCLSDCSLKFNLSDLPSLSSDLDERILKQEQEEEERKRQRKEKKKEKKVNHMFLLSVFCST